MPHLHLSAFLIPKPVGGLGLQFGYHHTNHGEKLEVQRQGHGLTWHCFLNLWRWTATSRLGMSAAAFSPAAFSSAGHSRHGIVGEFEVGQCGALQIVWLIACAFAPKLATGLPGEQSLRGPSDHDRWEQQGTSPRGKAVVSTINAHGLCVQAACAG